MVITHIDDWIDDERNDATARAFFIAARRPAIDKMKEPYEGKLFCTWQGRRYRVTGASRLGDIWLAEDFFLTSGYDHRVDVTECSEWSDVAVTLAADERK